MTFDLSKDRSSLLNSHQICVQRMRARSLRAEEARRTKSSSGVVGLEIGKQQDANEKGSVRGGEAKVGEGALEGVNEIRHIEAPEKRA